MLGVLLLQWGVLLLRLLQVGARVSDHSTPTKPCQPARTGCTTTLLREQRAVPQQRVLTACLPACPSPCLPAPPQVAPSPVFHRDDFDLLVEVPVDMVDAALGTTVE